MDVETVYMPLVCEGTEVWAPAQAVRHTGNAFLVLGPMPDDQHWKYSPDTVVGVKFRVFDDGTVKLVATRPVKLEVDHRKFNIRNADGLYLCPVCGYPGYFTGDSYYKDGGAIGTGRCPCCGFEPGYDDDPTINEFTQAEETVIASISKYRRAWVLDGMTWRGGGAHANEPDGWDGAGQLVHLLETAPWIAKE